MAHNDMKDDTGDMTSGEHEESVGTVLVAGAANLGIAIAKVVGGLVSGSSAMLSEAAHSVADSVTEVLLLTALARSRRPADSKHPMGHSRERYVWALLASVATFVAGAVFSVYEGVRTLLGGEKLGSPTVSYVVLVVAFCLEGSSLMRAVRQVRREARRNHVPSRRYLRGTADTTVKAVVLEDSAALIGLVLAAGGVLGGQLSGSHVWDGIASLLIGSLLVVVAVVLGRDNTSMLIGRGLPPKTTAAIRKELEAIPQVASVIDLVAVVHGPDDVVVTAKVDFVPAATSDEVERASDVAEVRLRRRFHSVSSVYLDPTPPDPEPPPERGEG